MKAISSSIFLTNVSWSFFLRGFSAAISFLIVSVLLKYLGKEEYGIWLTISSVLTWISFFDFGIANGLQNQVTSLLAQGHVNKAKQYISTTYVLMITIIAPLLIILLLIATTFIDWSKILHVSNKISTDLRWMIVILGISTILQLVLRLVTAVLFAHQKTNLIELTNVLIQLFIGVTLYLANSLQDIKGSTLYITTIISGFFPILGWILTSVYVYKWKYPDLIPRRSLVDWSYSKKILRVGASLTILQLYGLVLFFTDNILISYLYGSKNVTEYSILTKYFSALTIGFSVFLLPYWSSLANAYANNLTKKIKNLILSMLALFVGFIVLCSVIFIYKNSLITLWLNTELTKDSTLAFFIAVYTLITLVNNIFSIYLNVRNTFRIQVIAALLVIVLNPVLSIYLGTKFHYGVSTIAVVNILCVGFFGVTVIAQSVYLLVQKSVTIEPNLKL